MTSSAGRLQPDRRTEIVTAQTLVTLSGIGLGDVKRLNTKTSRNPSGQLKLLRDVNGTGDYSGSRSSIAKQNDVSGDGLIGNYRGDGQRGNGPSGVLTGDQSGNGSNQILSNGLK